VKSLKNSGGKLSTGSLRRVPDYRKIRSLEIELGFEEGHSTSLSNVNAILKEVWCAPIKDQLYQKSMSLDAHKHKINDEPK
jgi:hypothetical protein